MRHKLWVSCPLLRSRINRDPAPAKGKQKMMAPAAPQPSSVVTADVIYLDARNEADLEKYKGKLAGKIVFFGPMRDVKPVDKALWERRDDADLKKTVEFPIRIGEREQFFQEFIKRLEFRQKAGKFFADEHAAGIVVPSRDGRNNGGSGGTIFDDGGSGMGWFTYKRESAEALPIVVMAIENYGRVFRLLEDLASPRCWNQQC